MELRNKNSKNRIQIWYREMAIDKILVKILLFGRWHQDARRKIRKMSETMHALRINVFGKVDKIEVFIF